MDGVMGCKRRDDDACNQALALSEAAVTDIRLSMLDITSEATANGREKEERNRARPS
jgi:hypothetical protein